MNPPIADGTSDELTMRQESLPSSPCESWLATPGHFDFDRQKDWEGDKANRVTVRDALSSHLSLSIDNMIILLYCVYRMFRLHFRFRCGRVRGRGTSTLHFLARTGRVRWREPHTFGVFS